MRLLQVNNVASLLGGTGQCALSIRHALPDFEHRVQFFGFGDVEPGIQSEFGSVVSINVGNRVRQEDLEWADLVIFHNTAMVNMPSRIPENCASVYYLHSNHKSAHSAASQCDIALCVSRFLQRDSKATFPVLHQPIKLPPKINPRTFDGPMKIARFCTPSPEKWKIEQVCELYSEAFSQFGSTCEFHFVGPSPRHSAMIEEIADDLKASVVSCDASTAMRSKLREWDVLLYSSDVVETYGRTVCEAQMCGCVPIVDNKGGFVEQIKHGYDGFLCNSIPEFMTAIDDTFYDRDRGFEMSQKAELSGAQRGSLSVWREKFLGILKGNR